MILFDEIKEIILDKYDFHYRVGDKVSIYEGIKKYYINTIGKEKFIKAIDECYVYELDLPPRLYILIYYPKHKQIRMFYPLEEDGTRICTDDVYRFNSNQCTIDKNSDNEECIAGLFEIIKKVKFHDELSKLPLKEGKQEKRIKI